MSKGILGRKVGSTEIFTEDGQAIPVTVLQAGPCHVLQLRTTERDGYEAVQVGFGDRDRDRATRSQRGQVGKISSKRARRRVAAGVELLPRANCEPKRFIREFRGPVEGFEVGQEIKADIFAEVKAVDVTGISKGRGFQGVMRRHHFSGQRASHGVKKVHRQTGGTGCSAYPSRTFKGLRMAGQYGNSQVTTRNLKVVNVDQDKNLLVVKGAVPGPNGGLVVIRETNKVK